MTDAGADVAERRYGQTKRVEQGVTHGYHEETRHHDEDEVDHKEGKYGATHLGGNLGVVDAHGEHGMGMPSIWRNSVLVSFHTMSTRMHLRPPLVDPAQAPMILINERMSQMVGCQIIKSSSEKPVVLCSETVLKKAMRNEDMMSMPSTK